MLICRVAGLSRTNTGTSEREMEGRRQTQRFRTDLVRW